MHEFKISNLTLRCETEITALVENVKVQWEREMRERREEKQWTRWRETAYTYTYLYLFLASVNEMTGRFFPIFLRKVNPMDFPFLYFAHFYLFIIQKMIRFTECNFVPIQENHNYFANQSFSILLEDDIKTCCNAERALLIIMIINYTLM